MHVQKKYMAAKRELLRRYFENRPIVYYRNLYRRIKLN